MKKIGVIIGAIVGAACAGITVYLLGNPFASAAVGFVWCYTGYFLGKYIEKKKGSNKQEKDDNFKFIKMTTDWKLDIFCNKNTIYLPSFI